MTLNPSKAGRTFVLCMLGLLALSTVCVAAIYWNIYGYDKLFGDFETFRKAATDMLAHDVSAVYDTQNAKRLFAAGELKQFSYFLNPPTGLFLVWPLGFVAPLTGLILWTLAQLSVLAAALSTRYARQLFTPVTAGANTGLLLIATCLAFCLQNILFGQMAVFCVALFVLVLAWRKTHPVWAGIALGLFSIKPQLGILLPVLLLAEGNFKTLLVALLTAALLALLSIGLWGTGLWQDYLGILAVRSEFLARDQSLLFMISTSAYAALRLLGLAATPALCVQSALALGMLLLVWPAFRKGRESDKVLMLTLATYFVTPYSLLYDMALLALPAAIMLRRAEPGESTRAELLALVFILLMPLMALLLQIAHVPYSVIAIGLALGVARRSVLLTHARTS